MLAESLKPLSLFLQQRHNSACPRGPHEGQMRYRIWIVWVMCGTCLLYCLDKNHQCLQLLASEPSTESLAPPLCSLVHLVPVPDGCRFGNGVGRRERWKDVEKELPVRVSGSTWDPQDHALLAHPAGMSWVSRGEDEGTPYPDTRNPSCGQASLPISSPFLCKLGTFPLFRENCPVCHLSPAHLSFHVWGKGKQAAEVSAQPSVGQRVSTCVSVNTLYGL